MTQTRVSVCSSPNMGLINPHDHREEQTPFSLDFSIKRSRGKYSRFKRLCTPAYRLPPELRSTCNCIRNLQNQTGQPLTNLRRPAAAKDARWAIPPIECKLKEIEMNWDIAEGNWNQFRGKVKAQWGKLTDDHLDVIAGKRIELAGKIQEAYGVTKDEAEKQIKQFEDISKD